MDARFHQSRVLTPSGILDTSEVRRGNRLGTRFLLKTCEICFETAFESQPFVNGTHSTCPAAMSIIWEMAAPAGIEATR